MQKSTPESWSEMWKSPFITTFGGEFENNYDGPILDFWKSQLHGDLRHVADLACGNGALTWIANDLLNADGNKARVTGVDIASIDPFAVLGRNQHDYPQVDFSHGLDKRDQQDKAGAFYFVKPTQ